MKVKVSVGGVNVLDMIVENIGHDFDDVFTYQISQPVGYSSLKLKHIPSKGYLPLLMQALDNIKEGE